MPLVHISHRRITGKRVLVAFAVICVSTTAPAAEKTDFTQLELNQAAGDKYQSVDTDLNRVYAEIRRLYAKDRRFLAKLQASQRLWLKLRDAETEALYPPHDDNPGYYGSVHAMCVAEYRAKLTADRVAHLKSWLVGPAEGDVCSGSIKPPERLKRGK